MTLDLREIGEEDLPAHIALYRHLNPADPPIDLEQAAQVLHRLGRYDGSTIFAGFVAGRPVTSCTLVIVPNLTRGARPYGLIENVVTDASCRGKGYATTILQAAAERAWRHDCYKLMLLTGSKNPATLRFYAKAGFEQSKTGFQMRRTAGGEV